MKGKRITWESVCALTNKNNSQWYVCLPSIDDRWLDLDLNYLVALGVCQFVQCWGLEKRYFLYYVPTCNETDKSFWNITITFCYLSVKNNYPFLYFTMKATSSHFKWHTGNSWHKKIWFLPACLLVSLQHSSRQFQYPPRQQRTLFEGHVSTGA